MANTNISGQPVRARILWPALGFPAVISPKDRPGESPFVQGDATRSICLLVASNRKFLSKEEVARSLRFVEWSKRGRRSIAAGQPGSFAEVEIAVRNDGPQIPLLLNQADERAQLVTFGANADGLNGIAAALGKPIREFYAQQGMPYLNEIRIYEQALSRLGASQYHLFWNNASPNENAPSDEMALLLRAFAMPRRQAEVGMKWGALAGYLMNEYEYEFGSLHRPYSDSAGGRMTRAEILHPLFINRRPSATLNVGHLTDLHIDVRSDVYEENLKQQKVRVSFANWNRSFDAAYAAAKPDSDILLLTGDLTDYGRGHWGIAQRQTLGDDSMYHRDRNWFLFYHLLAAGDAYSRPAYTSLGNHDWRLNPYPPFALAGAPAPGTLIHNISGLTADQQNDVLRKAHLAGYDPSLSYDRRAEAEIKPRLGNIGHLVKLAANIVFRGLKTLNRRGWPTETTIDSIKWYLLAINPFLDYTFSLPGGHSVLMIDWAEAEHVLFPVITDGHPQTAFNADIADQGPSALKCLTDLEMTLVKRFTDAPGRAKILGIHTPPLAPWYDWTDDELAVGWKPYQQGGRGNQNYIGEQNGKKVRGHPFFAIEPKRAVKPGGTLGMEASWNSFDRYRPDLIRLIADPRRGVRLVLGGHIHRKGLLAAYQAGTVAGPGIMGDVMLKSIPENAVSGVRAPAAANGASAVPGPLYVNTTSLGPRGHVYPAKGIHAWLNPGYAHLELVSDGTIQKVVFRWILPANIPTTLQPSGGTVSPPPSVTPTPRRAPAGVR